MEILAQFTILAHHELVLVSHVTEPAPGGSNEDFVAASDSFVVVLDGVTELPGLDTGCAHGPVWLAGTLGELLMELLGARPDHSLKSILRDAIGLVKDRHVISCDLTNPNSPSATVAIVRERGDLLDYLVLCDSAVVFEYDDHCVAVTDDRTARLPAYDRVSVARLRNTPEGFWVASTAPEAADHALTGSVERDRPRTVLVCTDGVSRLVEIFGWTWPEVLKAAEVGGPHGLIDAVRRAERSGLPPSARPRKLHDDATVAICRIRAAAASGS